jgi:hypothetical protein
MPRISRRSQAGAAGRAMCGRRRTSGVAQVPQRHGSESADHARGVPRPENHAAGALADQPDRERARTGGIIRCSRVAGAKDLPPRCPRGSLPSITNNADEQVRPSEQKLPACIACARRRRGWLACTYVLSMPHSICVVAVPVLLGLEDCPIKKGLEDWSGSGTRPCDMCVVRERPTYEVRIHLLHAQKQVCPCLVPDLGTQIPLCKKEIPHHIKISANVWSTKYR